MRQVGVTGKPNVGKSTFFAASTLARVEIANYPFTTKEPNVGVGYARAKEVADEFHVVPQPNNSYSRGGWRFVAIQLVDLPGLVPGAHAGRGLGNQFLTAVSTADALLHVVDASGGTDQEGRPVAAGSHDVLQDVTFLEEEYELWLSDVVKRNWGKVSRRMGTTKTDLDQAVYDAVTNLTKDKAIVKQIVEEMELPEDPKAWKDEHFQPFAKALRSKTQPVLIVANKADTPEAEENIKRLRERGYDVIPTSAEAELVLRRADKAGLIEYVASSGDFVVKEGAKLTAEQRKALDILEEKVLKKWGNTGVQLSIDRAIFDLLGMVAVFPVEDPRKLTDGKGRVLPDVYLMDRGSTARDLAGTIHTDLAAGFLYAVDARTKVRLAEDYVLKNGDVISVVSAAK